MSEMWKNVEFGSSIELSSKQEGQVWDVEMHEMLQVV